MAGEHPVHSTFSGPATSTDDGTKAATAAGNGLGQAVRAESAGSLDLRPTSHYT